LIAFLLPARNAAGDLPGYLESVAEIADVVVALDDGSTDATREILEASPLVETLLTAPRREGEAGWNDSANRRRLLEAAARLTPDWMIFLDADERLDREDAAALRRFIATDALPGCAYGLELHRMWGDDRCVSGFTWVYRLFSYAPGQTLPRRRLHFNPIPAEIPRGAWVRTTIRIRHLDSPSRLAARRAKYRAVDPERAYERRPARLLDEPREEELVPWSRRDPGTPVLDLDRVALRARAAASEAAQDRRRDRRERGDRPELVCLMPVRDGADHVAGYLESAGAFADAVIALDDGSTDATAELLERAPLVERVLRNPPREGFAGWDDAGNRSKLLAAAADLEPRWVLWLDTDERIDPDDGAALRRFLENGAEPGHAYGLRVFRMIDDEEHYDDAGLWAYRLFAWEPGQELPRRRLHLVPIPTSIPRSRWLRTTIRVKHLSSLTPAHRAARLLKHVEADPDRQYQSDYSHLARPPGTVRRWHPRPPGLPVLADPLEAGRELDLHDLDLDAPILSAIVISRDDEDRIERAVRSVVEQECPHPFEVIVVVSGTDRTAEKVRERFPDVTLIHLGDGALPGRARNAGLAAARGDIVSFPGSHVELPQGSLAARVRAHERGYAMVTGSIVNGTVTRSGWASYFLDHAAALPGRPSKELQGPPDHCSYVREFLLAAGGFPEDMRAGEDTVANRRLARQGHRAYRSQEIRLVHRSRCTNPVRLVRHHFVRGRALGRIVSDSHRGGRRVLRRDFLAAYLLRYVPRRLRRIDESVARWGAELSPQYRSARPLIALGALGAWSGLWFELLRPGRGKLSILLVDQRGRDVSASSRGGYPASSSPKLSNGPDTPRIPARP
jgi:glycosyltransferase involved in cell wall biosynthesis